MRDMYHQILPIAIQPEFFRLWNFLPPTRACIISLYSKFAVGSCGRQNLAEKNMFVHDPKDRSHIARRIEKCLQSYVENDYESSSIQLWPAIDNTAKQRYKTGVGARIKEFLRDYEALITHVAMNNVMVNFELNGKTLIDILYEECRNSIAHEGRLPATVSFNEGTTTMMMPGPLNITHWYLSKKLIMSLSLAVIVAPENKGCSLDSNCELSLYGKTYDLNELWGEEAFVYELMSREMGALIKRRYGYAAVQ